jgi:glutamyl-Q tRNA(Asp) synthetase
LHLGHAYSALLAHDMARAHNGRFLLRIDDLDQSRARPQWENQIYDDLTWLGITWDGPVRRQSDHFGAYRKAIKDLAAKGGIYPCRCKRRDIEAAVSAPQEGGQQFGADGLIYPGTCRDRRWEDRRDTDALRFNIRQLPEDLDLTFQEFGPAHRGLHHVTPAALQTRVGDPIVARPNMAASYHFSVVLDDAASEVTHVVRGEDLFEATYIQRLFQHQLAQPTPVYHHHRLIRDADGKRLAKRDDARAISKYRQDGATPADIRNLIGLPPPG